MSISKLKDLLEAIALSVDFEVVIQVENGKVISCVFSPLESEVS